MPLLSLWFKTALVRIFVESSHCHRRSTQQSVSVCLSKGVMYTNTRILKGPSLSDGTNVPMADAKHNLSCVGIVLVGAETFSGGRLYERMRHPKM